LYPSSSATGRCRHLGQFASIAVAALLAFVQGDDSVSTAAEAGYSATSGERESFVVPPLGERPEELAPLEYVEVGGKIPNYVPSAVWGTQGKPLTKMQKPLAPEQSRRRFVMPEGFGVEPYAAEGDLGPKPIAMNWDHRGRLWICESVDYPNALKPPNKGNDRIRVCEDVDADGRADRFTVFAEDLSIPTAITFYRDGVIVQNGVETLYLKDTDGDGRADGRKVLIDGWALGDTHGGVSNFRYGPDNWYWAMQGYNDSRPSVDGQQRAAFRMGFWRFRLDGNDPPSVAEIEFLGSTNNNTWGLGFNEAGEVFGSTANRNPSVFLGIPNRYYERVRGWSREPLGTIADSHLFEPYAKQIRQVDHHGGYTAAAGHALYTARAYPQTWWNRTAFVCGPTGHLVGTLALEPDGAGYRATYRGNLIASDDGWSAPIAAEAGPDGFVWLIDWYNYIVQHNPTPKGFKTGRGNAYETDLRDKAYGRIYRVVHEAAPTSAMAWQPLDGEDAQTLVATLAHPTMRWRLQAQRLLVERDKADVVPALCELVTREQVDAIGIDAGAIHALRVLDGLGVVRPDSDAWPTVLTALLHESAAVRMNAVQVLPPVEQSAKALFAAECLDDADVRVQKVALLKLAELEASDAVGTALMRYVNDHRHALEDRWLREAFLCAAAAHARPFLASLDRLLSPSDLKSPARDALRDALIHLAEHFARGRPDAKDCAILADAMTGSDATWGLAVLNGTVRGWPEDHQIRLAENAGRELARWQSRLSPLSQSRLVQLSGPWQVAALSAQRQKLAMRLAERMLDDSLKEAQRADAARQMIQLDPESPDPVLAIVDVVTPAMPPSLATSLLEALEESRCPDMVSSILEAWSRWTPALRQTAARVLLARIETTEELLEQLAAGGVAVADLALVDRQRLLAHPNEDLRKKAAAALGQGGVPSPDRAAVIERLMPLVEKRGSAERGKVVFTKHCATCHQFQGEGATIGPDLTGMAVHPREELLTQVMDPSRSVEGNFHVYTLVLADGRILSGMLGAESRTSLELIDAQAKRHTIERSDIDEIVATRKSLMPEGFEQQLSPEQLVDLLEYLTTPGRYLPVSLHRVATASSSGPLFLDKPNGPDRLVWPTWGMIRFEEIPFTIADPRGGRVANAIVLYGPRGKLPPQLPRAVSIDCRMPLRAIHILGGVSGWGYPAHPAKSESMTVRLHYADGGKEDHPLVNGVHFADYIRRVDVPKSRFAFDLDGRQVRYLSIEPEREEVIERIEFVKGDDPTAPVIVAISLEPRTMAPSDSAASAASE